MKPDKVCAIIVAAGQGKRMNKGYNKQYILLEEKPILVHTLETISGNNNIDYIILVVPKDEIDYCKKEIIEKYNIQKVLLVVAGGEERQNSVYAGIKNIDPNTGIVLIHDGARPFISNEIINKSIREAINQGAVVVAVPVKDTIKVVNEELEVIDTPNRETLWSIQTPQVFSSKIIKKAYEEGIAQNFRATDDAMMVEAIGHKVKIVLGSYENIKITTPEDIILAEQILLKRWGINESGYRLWCT